MAEEKTVGPHTVLQFAGITLDTVKQEARLPDDKLQKCCTLLHAFDKRRKLAEFNVGARLLSISNN